MVEAARLKAIPLFASLADGEREAVAQLAGELEVPEGQMVTAEGEFGHCLFAIEEGTADVLREGEKLRSLGPGDVVGEIAVLAAGRRSATVVATSPMRLLTFFKRDVWSLERSAPEAARRLSELLRTRETPAGA
jgi:CRP-like cAMP-binding protein